ncbi:hypothetical protein ACWDA7_52865 [Streptomyces sp. NPDC001156]
MQQPFPLDDLDAATPADEPLLTALIAAADTSDPALYQRLGQRLGREVPSDAARARWQTDVLQLHQLYRYK